MAHRAGRAGARHLARERFAQFNSAAWLCTSLGIMIAAPASGWLLDPIGQRYAYIYLWAFAVLRYGGSLMRADVSRH